MPQTPLPAVMQLAHPEWAGISKERPGVTFLKLVCHFARCKVQCAVVDTVQDARTFCSSRGPEFDCKTFKCLRFNEEQWPEVTLALY